MRVSSHRAGEPGDFAFTPETMEQAKQVIARYPEGREASATIALLDLAQRQNGGWLPGEAIEYVANFLEIAPIRVHEVASFYSMYNSKPVGTHFIQVCRTTPCWLRGSDDVVAACQRQLGIDLGETTADGKFTLAGVECLGACVNAPMVQIFADTYEDLTPKSFEKVLDAIEKGRAPTPGPQIKRNGAAPVTGLTSLTGKPNGPAKSKMAEESTVATLAEPAKPSGTVGKPQLYATSPADGADNLKEISGVGPKLEKLLNSLGIYKYDQVAAWSAGDIAWVDARLTFKGRIARDDWMSQAKTLAEQGDVSVRIDRGKSK